MHTVVSYPPRPSRARDVAGLLDDYLAFDHVRSWRRDLARIGCPMAFIAMIAGLSGRLTSVECGAAVGLFTVPPAVVWLIERQRWRRIEKVVRKS